jgi:hypothetical protein
MAIIVDNSIIGGLQFPPSAWTPAIVQGAQCFAALKSNHEALAFQQLAVSHAAHNTLAWVFHGTRNYAFTDKSFKSILSSMGLDPTPDEGKVAAKIGREAARFVISRRADDGINDFVDMSTVLQIQELIRQHWEEVHYPILHMHNL